MEKKSIIFFSRSELTFLYGSVHKYLRDKFDIIHIAYSEHEAKILSSAFGITDLIVFKDVAKTLLDVNLQPNNLEEIDAMLITTSDGRFNLNSMLQSNRTSAYIGYENAIHTANVYYLTWMQIFNGRKVHFFIHEPVSLMLNQMAEAVCKMQGGVYTTHILVHGDRNLHNFIMVDHYNGVPVEIAKAYSRITAEELFQHNSRIIQFLTNFRSSYDIFFNALGEGENNLKLRTKLRKSIFRQRIKNLIVREAFHPVLDNIELFIHKDNLALRRLKNINSYNGIKYDMFDPTIPYYFFPLHLEPEAVVLYWAEGLYTNQVKLIENIAAQLPAGVLLYVKDHPHLYGYRDKIDYDRIQSIPNVRLLKTSISGKQIIKDCIGVITINGTGGFEALLMNKHVITFGSAFYGTCTRVNYVENIKELRKLLYELKTVKYVDDDNLKKFVLAYLESQKEGFTDFYGGMHKMLNVDLNINGNSVARGFQEYFLNYNK